MKPKVGHSCDLGVGHSCDLPPPRLARVSSHFLLMIYSRTFGCSKIGGGFAATAIYAPSGPSGRGELPPKGCISAVTKKIKIENEQSEITPLVCLDAQRPSA